MRTRRVRIKRAKSAENAESGSRFKGDALLRSLLVKSSLGRAEFERAYQLLDVPPFEGDCGRLCGKICCQEYERGVGMYLLPGEECMFTGDEPWLRWKLHSAENRDFPGSWKGFVAFAECDGWCPRECRPIQCRTFPLMPYIPRDGGIQDLKVVLDEVAGILICPLVRNPERHPLREEFRSRALEAWKVLANDPLIRDDILLQSRRFDEEQGSSWRKLFRGTYPHSQ